MQSVCRTRDLAGISTDNAANMTLGMLTSGDWQPGAVLPQDIYFTF
jgi:hypothetical protein